MANVIDEILTKFDLKYEDLSDSEHATLNGWLSVLQSNQLDIEAVKRFVHALKGSIEDQLVAIKETPQDWVSIVSLFIPFYGLIKKWYQDQNRLGLEMRLRNIILIESFLESPAKAKEALQRQIASLVSSRKTNA